MNIFFLKLFDLLFYSLYNCFCLGQGPSPERFYIPILMGLEGPCYMNVSHDHTRIVTLRKCRQSTPDPMSYSHNLLTHILIIYSQLYFEDYNFLQRTIFQVKGEGLKSQIYTINTNSRAFA